MAVDIGVSDVAAVAIASITAVVTVYIMHQTKVTSEKISNFELKLDSLESKIKKNHLLGEEMERVTLDLHSKIQLIYALVNHYKSTGSFSDIIAKRIREMKTTADKHLYELELLSSNNSKRYSALQALSKGAGDVETLRVFSELINIEEDVERKTELIFFFEKLYSRLRGPLTYDSRAWTGRD